MVDFKLTIFFQNPPMTVLVFTYMYFIIYILKLLKHFFLGQEFYTAEDNSFTLRRKLFGHPQRDSDGCHGDERPNPEDGSYIEPRTRDTQ